MLLNYLHILQTWSKYIEAKVFLNLDKKEEANNSSKEENRKSFVQQKKYFKTLKEKEVSLDSISFYWVQIWLLLSELILDRCFKAVVERVATGSIKIIFNSLPEWLPISNLVISQVIVLMVNSRPLFPFIFVFSVELTKSIH